MRDMMRVARRMELPATPRFRFGIQLILDGEISGIGAMIEISNLDELIGDSKDLYIEFWDAVVREHPSPSEGDRHFL